MDQEITQAVEHDTKADKKFVIQAALYSVVKQGDAWRCKNDKKDVVAFKDIGIFRLVMIGVEIPHRSVHHVFVCTPSYAFHGQKSTQKNQKKDHFIIDLSEN